jgi:hypothetical protein
MDGLIEEAVELRRQRDRRAAVQAFGYGTGSVQPSVGRMP